MTVRDKAYDIILRLMHGASLTLTFDGEGAEDRKQIFFDSAKEFIRADYGRVFGWYIEINSDCKGITKKLYGLTMQEKWNQLTS